MTTAKQIESRLTNKHHLVRINCARRSDFFLTPAQIDRCLSDTNKYVRLAIAQRRDIQFSPEQIELGLNDEANEVRIQFSSQNISRQQLERGLTDESWMVREAFASRCDDLSEFQIERGLTDEVLPVRITFQDIYDLMMTEEQVERVLTDSAQADESGIDGFVFSTKKRLSDAQIERGLTDLSWRARYAFINRPEFIPTASQIDRGIQLAETDEELEAWRSAIARSITNDSTFAPKPARRSL